MADGINIYDVTRSFFDQEWASFSSEKRRHVHEECEHRHTVDQGPARDIQAASAASTVTDESTITFEGKIPPPVNNNGGAGRAAGFGRGAHRGQRQGRGRVGG